jgi:signal transduction histidine kinase
VFHSIRWRLVASYVLLTLLSVTIVGVLATEIVRRYTQQQEVKELKANAQSLAKQLMPLMWVNASPQQIHSLTQATSFLGDIRVRILDREGQILADSGSPGPTKDLVLIYPPEESEHISFQNGIWFNLIMPMMNEPFPSDVIDSLVLENLPAGTTFQFIQRATGPWGERFTFEMPHTREDITIQQPRQEGSEISRSANVIREPIGSSGNPIGYVELSAGQDFSAAALKTTRQAFLLAGAGATLLAVIVGLAMSQRLTSPLRTLQEVTGRMGSGDFTARAPALGRDEIGSLAIQFNQMADQLQANFTQIEEERDALKRFIADASHELRTPVTALKNFLTLIQGPAADDQPAQAEFLSKSQEQVERLEWITRNLLDLSRLDAGLVELDFTNHDLSELVEVVTNPYKALAIEQHISLKIQSPEEPVIFLCDASQLKIALSNLLDNALKFTPSGGEVEIGVEQSKESIRLWVRDTGTGIHPDDLPRIFNRFYRGRHHTSPGSGLGLAITKSLVEAQGGSLLVDSPPSGGSVFTIEFPTSI